MRTLPEDFIIYKIMNEKGSENMFYTMCAHVLVLFLGAIMLRKHSKQFYVLATFILSFLAYYVVVTENMDLYRYTGIMEYVRLEGFDWGMKTYGPSNPLAFLFLYGVSMLNNDALLAPIAVAITYGLSFALLYKSTKRFNASLTDTYIALVFFMFNMNYCYVIDVVRIYIAFAIMAYFIYMDIVEKKHRILCFAVYGALCYFHYVMAVFVILRVLLILTRRFKGALSTLVSLVVPIAIFIAYKFVEGFSGESLLFNVANDKLLGYKDYEVFGIWQFIASMVRVAVFIVICFIGKLANQELKNDTSKIDSNHSNIQQTMLYAKRNSDLLTYILYVILTIFLFITNYQYVLRIPYFAQILMSFAIILALTKLRKHNAKNYTFLAIIVLFESFVHFIYLLVYVYKVLHFNF